MRPGKQEIAAGYDRVADRIRMEDGLYRAVLSLLPPLPETARLLDLGCGQGRLLELVRDGGGPAAFGGDLSPELCRRARRRLGPRIARLDAERLPFARASFDAVVLTEVLEHLLDPVAALRGIREVLRPGGALVLSVPNRAWPRYRRYLRTRDAFQPVDDRWYRPAEVCALLAAADLRVDRLDGYGSLLGGALVHRGLAAVLRYALPLTRRRRKRLLVRARS